MSVLNPLSDPKALIDTTERSNAALSTAQSLVDVDRLREAAEIIEAAEKHARNSGDGFNGSKLVVWWFEVLMGAAASKNDESMFNDGIQYITSVCKKRLQLKKTQIDLVQAAMNWIDKLPNKDLQFTLLETLCNVTEGKIFVEVERARIVLKIAHMKEADGAIDTAANLLQEVQVEANIAMDKFEKANYILEQLRLVFAKGDYTRAQIVSRKINPSTIKGPKFGTIRCVYNYYLVKYYNYLNQFEKMGDCYNSLLDGQTLTLSPCKDVEEVLIAKDGDTETKGAQDVDDAGVPKEEQVELERLMPFLPAGTTTDFNLTKWNIECSTLLIAMGDESCDKQAKCKGLFNKYSNYLPRNHWCLKLLTDLSKQDVTAYPPAYMSSVLTHPLIADDQLLPGSILRRRGLEQAFLSHNLMVISKYYTITTLADISRLIECQLGVDVIEDALCRLITKGTIPAKINRPKQTVQFMRHTDVVADWNGSINVTLECLSEVCHQIEKKVDSIQIDNQKETTDRSLIVSGTGSTLV